MNTVYYIETNLTCILVLAILLIQNRRRVDRFSTNVVSFDPLVIFAIVLSAADMVAGIWRGFIAPGSRLVIEASNIVYFVSVILVSYQWAMYVFVRLGKEGSVSQKTRLMWALPLIVFCLIALANPFTDFLFSIDENNLYVRGPGVFLHWIVAWFYFAASFIMTLVTIVKEPSKIRRKEIAPYLSFIVAPAVGSIAQMSFYGVTSIQVGITLSILLLFLFDQDREILTDPLTGMNNRRHFERYFARALQGDTELDFFIIMFDLNAFKRINDTYGHVVGDQALREAAGLLRAACATMPSRVMVCRYGGDEFLVAGEHATGTSADDVISALRGKVHERNAVSDAPYHLAFAAGTATNVCHSMNDVEQMLIEADTSMYEFKKSGQAID